MRQILSIVGGGLFTFSAVGIAISVIKLRTGKHIPLSTALMVCGGAATLGIYSLGIEPFDWALFGSYCLTFLCWLPALVIRRQPVVDKEKK
jgi:hypothetical protein